MLGKALNKSCSSDSHDQGNLTRAVLITCRITSTGTTRHVRRGPNLLPVTSDVFPCLIQTGIDNAWRCNAKGSACRDHSPRPGLDATICTFLWTALWTPRRTSSCSFTSFPLLLCEDDMLPSHVSALVSDQLVMTAFPGLYVSRAFCLISLSCRARVIGT